MLSKIIVKPSLIQKDLTVDRAIGIMLNKLAGTVCLDQQLICLILEKLHRNSSPFIPLEIFLPHLSNRRQPASNSCRRCSFSARSFARVFFFGWLLIVKQAAVKQAAVDGSVVGKREGNEMLA